MAYKLVVEIKVVDEDGGLVDYRGHTSSATNMRPSLYTKQDFREFAHIENAHAALNSLHAVVKAIKELP